MDLGAAGGLVVVLNGDILADVDLGAMLRFHAERRARATIYLTRVADPTPVRAGGARGGRPHPALRREARSVRVTMDTINAGVYVLDRELVAAIPTGRAVSIEREILPRAPRATACRSSAGWPTTTGSTSAAPPSTGRASSTCWRARSGSPRSRPALPRGAADAGRRPDATVRARA